MSDLITRTLSVIVVPDGEPIFSERAFVVSIEDEAAVEFVTITSQEPCAGDERKVRIDTSDWPELRAAVDRMISECRN